MNQTSFYGKLADMLSVPGAIILATIFSISVIFTAAYILSFVYLIGYDNQLLPLFQGIIIGTVIFASIGSVLSHRSRKYLYVSAAVAALLYLIVHMIMLLTRLVVPNSLLTVISIMMTSAFLPATDYAMSFIRTTTVRKIIVPTAVSILGIISIAYIAILYEASGQDNLASITVTLSYMALISVLAVFLLAFRHFSREKPSQ